MMRFVVSTFFLLLCSNFVHVGLSADLIRILPVTDQILVLHFDEGHIDYFGIHQDRYNGNVCYYSSLEVSRAIDPANYDVSSADDERYAEAQHPLNTGRKSKGVDFNNIYDRNEPNVIKHHWIYLELPFAMEEGKSYTVSLNDIASNVNTFTFNYDIEKLRSQAIHVNQIGFVPEAPKYAYISHFMGSFNTATHVDGGLNLDGYADIAFHIVRVADDSVMYSGTIAKQRDKTDQDFLRTDIDFEDQNMTRADVWECDFSDFMTPGEYKVVVEGMGCSYPFEIHPDAYREPYYFTSRAMFTQRAGIQKEIEPGLIYPRSQHPDDGRILKYYPDLQKEENFDPDQSAGEVQGVWGWYHDAGDWDGYPDHYRVPMTLLALYDLKPENFGDGDVGNRYKISGDTSWIDEGANGLPDVLDEAMWLIQFYKRVQDSLISQGYTTGGIPGYAGVDAGAGDGKPSWEDTRVMALKGADSVMMSYRYAACTAWLAICLNKFQGGTHPESAGWLSEATTAYSWAQAKNQDVADNINRAKMEAAAALYRFTGDSGYQDDFKTCKEKDGSWGNLLWFNIQPWHYAATLFAMIPDDHPGLDTDFKQQCIETIATSADMELVQTAQDRGFRYGLDKNIIFMLGTFSTPHIYTAAVAYELTGEQKFLDACYTTADYCLGGNQMGMVKVSGLGENYERQPFHPDSWYLIDYNSRVYTNPILPGYVIYEMHRTGDWFLGESWNWIGDEDYSRSTAYPSISNFPDAEARFWNRNNIPASEFTIHQTQIMALFAYGYLCGNHSGAYTVNTRPTVALNLEENQTIKSDSLLTLTVTASQDVRRVEYYYDWHFIGESTDRENGFMFVWDMSKYQLTKGKRLITAKAYDDKGMESKPADEGDKIINIEIVTSLQEERGGVWEFDLKNNYPNPVNPSTLIGFSLPRSDHTRLDIYNTLGEEKIMPRIQSVINAV